MGKELEVVDLKAHYRGVGLVFVRKLAVFDVEGVRFLHCSAVDQRKTSLSEDVCLGARQECFHSDLFTILKQLNLIN